MIWTAVTRMIKQRQREANMADCGLRIARVVDSVNFKNVTGQARFQTVDSIVHLRINDNVCRVQYIQYSTHPRFSVSTMCGITIR